MKRVFTAVAAFLLAIAFSASVSAHSHLQGSTPADGDAVTEPLTEIVLEFDGQIEQGSFIEVTTAGGQKFEPEQLIIGEGTLTGTFAQPLANDEYQVNWSIISADGHPLEGEFSFTVNAPASEAEEEAAEEPAETTEPSQTPEEETTEPDEQSTENQEEAATADEAEESASSSMGFVFIVLLAVLAAGGFFLLKRKK
ncbi:copper resistance protein CopC [Bacillus sp. FJAT-27251]|uniref:copper resistance CopC family protein n=1 Tax=Bacillus sp. FJAT-27251 TaxID=1684142 RepID=UPI0018D11FD5|nr:copper resistance protein CopC [Bacillus sp. FJAT-27251]